MLCASRLIAVEREDSTHARNYIYLTKVDSGSFISRQITTTSNARIIRRRFCYFLSYNSVSEMELDIQVTK